MGSSIALPCNITPPITQDALLLLLFYRNESNQPLYTLDSRHTSLLSNATFYYSEETEVQSNNGTLVSSSIPMISSKHGSNNRRYEFQLKSPISHMIIKKVGKIKNKINFNLFKSSNFKSLKQLNSADQGLYRCRTDFRHSRTINRLVRLYITGKFRFFLLN